MNHSLSRLEKASPYLLIATAFDWSTNSGALKAIWIFQDSVHDSWTDLKYSCVVVLIVLFINRHLPYGIPKFTIA